MGFRINTNVNSLSAQRSLSVNTNEMSSSLTKLASGARINSAADDAAGLAISEKFRSQIVSTRQAERNANDGISMIQTAEGGLNEISNILTRMRELSIQAASDTVGQTERGFSNLEYQNLKQEIQRIAQVTEFNGQSLLDGKGEKYDLQIGIRNDEFEDRISYNAQVTNATIAALGIDQITIGHQEGARDSLEMLDSAIERVSGQRAELGAVQNRLTSTVQNLQISNENQETANSRIRDTDYAAETANRAKLSILQSAGTSVLAQANASGQNALTLIG